MSTVTAGDYTVEFEIQKKDYLEWKAAVYDASNGYKERDYSPALALKEYMAQQIEETLDEWIRNNPGECQIDPNSHKKKKKKEGQADEPSQTKVADIVFSFDNRKLILGLRERGAAIARNDFNTMR